MLRGDTASVPRAHWIKPSMNVGSQVPKGHTQLSVRGLRGCRPGGIQQKTGRPRDYTMPQMVSHLVLNPINTPNLLGEGFEIFGVNS